MGAKRIAKAKANTRKPRKTTQQVPQAQLGQWWTPFRKIWAGVVGVSVVLGIAAAIAAFVPHVSLELSQPSDPSDIFSAVAGLHNISAFTLTDFHPYVGLCEILGKRAAEAPPTMSACAGKQAAKMVSPKWPARPLRTDE